MDTLEIVGARVRTALKATGLTQVDFANRAGTSNGYVSEICRGAKRPGTDLLVALGDVLGVSPSWVLYGQGPMLLRDLEETPRPAPVPSTEPAATAPLTSDIEARWGELASVTRAAVEAWDHNGRELLRQASAAPAEPADPHPLYVLVDRVLETCPRDEVTRAEGYLEALTERCTGDHAAAKSA